MIAQINNTVIKSILFCCNQLVNKFEKKINSQPKLNLDLILVILNKMEQICQPKNALRLNLADVSRIN